MRRTLEKLAQERQEKEKELGRRLDGRKQKGKKELVASFEEIVRQIIDLVDAKDREWDALGSNHVGLIFKSLEWRVDKLAAESEDATLLMKKFILLREKLDRVLAALEEKRLPQPEEARALLEPLEDWRYTGFENRFRGRDEEVKKQLREYVSYFPKDRMVLDLGCGRGEFLELLREEGIEVSRLKIAPGGTLVLETVNPLSVFALVQVYYLDLSHRNPIHPQALKFMLEASGFEDVEIKFSSPLEKERLQPLPGADERTVILNRNIDSLNELLFGPVNYAAVARRREQGPCMP